MKVIIRNNNYVDVVYCPQFSCSCCPFRFKCYTNRDSFEISTEELDSLALIWLPGKELLELFDKKTSGNMDYYKGIFYKLMAENDLGWGFIPLLTLPL